MPKRSQAELRLVRSATAYRRLAWKAGYAGQTRQAEAYERRADALMRQAEAIRERRARH